MILVNLQIFLSLLLNDSTNSPKVWYLKKTREKSYNSIEGFLVLSNQYVNPTKTENETNTIYVSKQGIINKLGIWTKKFNT